MALTERLASDPVLDRAFVWLCRQRRRWPDFADVWGLRRGWAREKAWLQRELRGRSFGLGLLDRFQREDGSVVEVFPARDALVLKALALVLERRLPVSRHCVHVKGHGGAKAAVRRAAARLRRLPFVLRTDVRGYYASIDPVKLVERLARFVPDPEILRLVAAITARSSERGGLFREAGGLPLGCPLSPLLGAFFLRELDARLEATGLFFVRFMDDILVLARPRWKLRRAVRIVNESLAALGLEKHPDKTFIGRAEKGFDFLGYRLGANGLAVTNRTWQRFAERAARLQEQERSGRAPPGALGAYVRRWQRWTTAGFGAAMIDGLGNCRRTTRGPRCGVWGIEGRLRSLASARTAVGAGHDGDEGEAQGQAA